MAEFAAKHLPKTDGISSSGTGTKYFEEKKYLEAGFPTLKSTDIVAGDGKTIKTVSTKTVVYPISPVKPVTKERIGKSQGVWIQVSTKSSTSLPEGYINVYHLEKPAGSVQSRVSSGASAQQIAADKIQEICAAKNLQIKNIDIVPKFSNKPDVTVTLQDGTKIQFEVKGTSDFAGMITFYDKTCRRGVSDDKSKEIDEYVREVLNSAVGGPAKLSEMQAAGSIPKNQSVTLQMVIDHERDKKQNYSVGYYGDRGVNNNSGRLPNFLKTTSTSNIRKKIISKLIAGGDHYFAAVNTKTNEVRIFSVPGSKNPLGLKDLPELSSFELSTYSGNSSGGTRVGVKAILKY